MEVLLTARQPSGGIRTFFRYIYGSPEFGDTRLTLVAPDKGLSEYLSRYIPENRLTFVPVGHSNREIFKASRKLLADRQYQLLHSHGFSAGVASELARLGTGIPHLMTAHDVFRPEQFRGLKGCITKHGLNCVYSRLDAIHTVTEDAKANLMEYIPRISPAKVHNILHGIDTRYFAEGQSQDLRNALGMTADQPLVGFFGRFMAQKGFRTLVDAVEVLRQEGELDPMPIVLTFGWGGYIREDYEYLRRKGLAAFFRQMPATDAMPDMLKSVDIVVMPSRWEACGLLAMEALTSGVPLIASNCVGLGEVLKGTPSRVVSPLDTSGLAREIKSEIMMPTRLRFEAYQSLAAERFAISRPAKELRKLYDMVANS